jgi:hypothetical protein
MCLNIIMFLLSLISLSICPALIILILLLLKQIKRLQQSNGQRQAFRNEVKFQIINHRSGDFSKNLLAVCTEVDLQHTTLTQNLNLISNILSLLSLRGNPKIIYYGCAIHTAQILKKNNQELQFIIRQYAGISNHNLLN